MPVTRRDDEVRDSCFTFPYGELIIRERVHGGGRVQVEIICAPSAVEELLLWSTRDVGDSTLLEHCGFAVRALRAMADKLDLATAALVADARCEVCFHHVIGQWVNDSHGSHREDDTCGVGESCLWRAAHCQCFEMRQNEEPVV